MGGGYFSNAGVFVLNTVFGLYIGAVLLRLLLQWTRADFHNPLSQAVVRLTNPALRPLRRYIPAIGRIDTASVALMFALQWLNLWLISVIFAAGLGFFTLIAMSVAELLGKLIYLYMFAIIIQAIASWVATGAYNPVLRLLDHLTSPLLDPVRRLLPNLGGLDLSPLVVIMLLQLALMVIVTPLTDFSVTL